MTHPFFSRVDAVLAVIAGIITLDFIRVPLTNDVAIFQGVAYIADRFYPFPQGVDLAWEAKPIGNRVINYLLFNAAEMFAPMENHAAFSMAVKGVAVLILMAIAAYSAYVIGGHYVFWIIFFAFISCANFCVLQAEWWAVLFAILAVSLLLHHNIIAPYLAGIIIIIIGTIKGITALLFVPIILSVVLLGKVRQNASLQVLGGFLLAVGTICIAQATIWKNMLPDLLLAPAIVGAGRIDNIPELLLAFVGQGVTSLFYIPAVFIGCIVALVLWCYGAINNREKYLIAGVWLATLAIVFAHGEYFIYHYFLLVLPAITTILFSIRGNHVEG